MNPNLENTNMAFATAAVTFAPNGLRGLILAAALAAIMSTANGGILGSSTVIYNDLLKDRITISADKEILVNRILAGIVCLLSVICALWIQSVLVALDVAYAYLSGCVFVPLVFAFILKRISARAGLYSLIASSVTVTIFFILDGITALTPIKYGVLVSAVVFFITNYLGGKKREINFYEGKIIIDGKEQNVQ